MFLARFIEKLLFLNKINFVLSFSNAKKELSKLL